MSTVLTEYVIIKDKISLSNINSAVVKNQIKYSSHGKIQRKSTFNTLQGQLRTLGKAWYRREAFKAMQGLI